MWTRELVELLIIKYQDNENLYNVQSPMYLDRVKRSNSLFSICQDLKTLNKDITVECIKKKIHTLRAQFIKESREIANSKRSGVGADDVYVPKLWCFPHLQFLKSHCTTRKSESNISKTDESDNSFMVDCSESQNSYKNESDNCSVVEDDTAKNIGRQSQNSYGKRKKNILEEKIDNVKKMYLEKSLQKNCYDWLGKQVVFEISKIKNQKIQRDAVWNIQQILRQASVEDAQDEPQASSSSSFLHIQSHGNCSSDQESAQIIVIADSSSQSSTLSANDILQQSLIGVLDDEDYCIKKL